MWRDRQCNYYCLTSKTFRAVVMLAFAALVVYLPETLGNYYCMTSKGGSSDQLFLKHRNNEAIFDRDFTSTFFQPIYFFQFLFGLLFPFSIWTYISPPYLDFYFPFIFGLWFQFNFQFEFQFMFQFFFHTKESSERSR